MTAKRRRGGALYICGGDETPGPRDDCPNPVHDFPLPVGYVDASEVAYHRLYKRWHNVRCKTCGLYGWVPPTGDTTTRTRPTEGSTDA